MKVDKLLKVAKHTKYTQITHYSWGRHVANCCIYGGM